jgi:iron complex outermembrane receptor protein
MRFASFLLITLGTGLSADAASLSGTILDASGAAVSRARLLVVSRALGTRWEAVADASGRYSLESLPAGDYLVEALADGLSMAPRPLTLTASEEWKGDLTLNPARVRSEVVVTATATALATNEIARALDTIRDTDITERNEYSLSEAVQMTGGVRVQSLGGPGAFTRILMRGLRPQDTSITIDGMRFRDVATTQGDASPFIENLMLVGPSRVDVLRGAGSSLYGTNAVGGVINVVTDAGGGPLHGTIHGEGGGLGFKRGIARVAGGALRDRLQYSAGMQHINVSRGVDGNDPYRNTSLQAYLQTRVSQSASLSGRLYGGDGYALLNDTPFAAPAALLPARGTIAAVPIPLDVQRRVESGTPATFPSGANFVPNLNDPDSQRSSRFAASSVLFTHQLAPRVSYRLSYQNVVTRRLFADGPAGVRFEPQYPSQDYIRGRSDTLQARSDLQLARWSLLSAGYEWEREHYLSRSRNTAPPPATIDYEATALQRSHAAFVHSQNRFFADRLQVSLSARIQSFDLAPPDLPGGGGVYKSVPFQSPPTAKTADAGVAWFQASTGTKLRAHAGNGYRSPSIYERVGVSFFNGVFTPLGDPRLRPDRSISLDAGIDQYLLRERLRVSVTQFYTEIREVVAFDSSGFVTPATDPFGRSGGYFNTGGGIARGIELSVETALPRRARLLASYTYTNSEQRNSTVRDRDFFQSPFISPRQFTAVITVPVTKRFQVTTDAWVVNRHPTIYSSRAFLFPGGRKVDLVASYTAPLRDTQSLRFFVKINNVFDSEYFENGFRSTGAWGTGGVAFQF